MYCTFQAIAAITSFKKRDSQQADDPTEQDTTEVNYPEYAYHSLAVVAPTEERQASNGLSSRGAGVVLCFPEVYAGWRFPSVVLAQCDEGYFYDLMVSTAAVSLLRFAA